MKLLSKIIILYCLLLPLATFSQKKWYRPFISKNDVLIYSAQFVAGSADGLNQVLVHHIHTFERVWPNANMRWWHPDSSQGNKKRFLTIFSDGFHTTRTIEHTMNYFSIGISFCDLKGYSKKQIPLLVAKKIILSMLINRAGFRLVYDVAFNDWKERPR